MRACVRACVSACVKSFGIITLYKLWSFIKNRLYKLGGMFVVVALFVLIFLL